MPETSKNHTISFDPNPTQKDIDFFFRKISSEAETVADFPKNHNMIGFFIRDNEGNIAGGVIGEIAWQWLYILYAWLREDLRNQGYGTLLMEKAESEAIKQGCGNSYLQTFDTQAPGFYKKLGYEVYGTLDDIPPGHTRLYMKKKLI
jgi:ribosomal protein S18 acetylase RimI-like enzyme